MQISSSIATRLQYQHKTLVDMIDGLTEEQIRRQPAPGKWSVFEIIVHLQTYQHVFYDRLKKIISGSSPEFEPYRAEDDPLFAVHCQKTFREIMQDFISTRKEMAAEMLVLPATELAKTGKHPVYRKMNVPEWINFFLLHEAHHFFRLFQMTAEIRKMLSGQA